MIRAWLDLSTPGMFAALAALYFGIALLLTLAVFCSPLTRPLQSLTGVVAPFFGSVAVLFALLTGFLANDVSDRHRQAVKAMQSEAGELHNLYTLSVAAASDMNTIRDKWRAYVSSVVSREWPAMADGKLSPSTYAAYDDLLKEVSNPAIAKESGQAVHTALLNAAVRVGTARSDRLALSSDATNDLKWVVVIVLGVFTQIAIALVHLEKPRAFVAALVVFSSAVIVALGIIALQEYPFYGPLQISSSPIAALQSLSE
ncbi:MAG TPA: DUF4239 domain-containing protein [Burkholderiales bacterium]|jgi:hypothetical protein|nr:DUF4239 domain-containing protein [Burkholderiales bacterium]